MARKKFEDLYEDEWGDYEEDDHRKRNKPKHRAHHARKPSWFELNEGETFDENDLN